MTYRRILLFTTVMLMVSQASSAQSITYSYDAAGNRVSRGVTVSRRQGQTDGRFTDRKRDRGDYRAPDRRPLRSQSIRSFWRESATASAVGTERHAQPGCLSRRNLHRERDSQRRIRSLENHQAAVIFP